MQASSNTATYTCPGKCFLLGEYAVLAGKPAIVAAVGPRFRLSTVAGEAFHPESPAGRLCAGNGQPPMSFDDPLRGRGGLGASSAQFVLSYLAMAADKGWPTGWRAIYEKYRQITAKDSAPSPSGADVVAQSLGGITLFDPESPSVENLSRAFDWSHLLIFSATELPGRKVATHQHLSELGDQAKLLAEPAAGIVREAIGAIQAQSALSLGRAFSAYADLLARHGLESPEAARDRRELTSRRGVAGAKGAGAMLADALVVVMAPDSSVSERTDVIAESEARGLRLVADGIEPEAQAGRVG